MTAVPVLQIITRLIVGGAQETVMYAADLLDPERFRVDVLSGPQTGSEGSLIEEVRSRGIPLTILPNLVRQVHPYHDALAVHKIKRFIRSGNYSIVHTNSSKAGILGRLAARRVATPVIVHTVHGWSFHEHMSAAVRRLYIAMERMAASCTDAFIVVTDQDIEKGLRAGIGTPERYHLIRSALPLEEFDPAEHDGGEVRDALGLPREVPVLGNIGRFSPQKNPLDWIRIAARVARQLPECRFLLVGDGPLRAQVEALLKQEGIAERTLLCGLRRDISRMLSAMDVFLLTSLWEGLPRVIPQALAMEVPVVANRADGTVEAITPDQTGFLADPGDLDALAAGCVELLQHPEKRRAMGRLGRRHAFEKFDVRQMVQQTADLYDRLLAEKDGSP